MKQSVLLLWVVLTLTNAMPAQKVDISFTAVKRAFEGAQRSVSEGCKDNNNGFIW
jgi:hypothetical protein